MTQLPRPLAIVAHDAGAANLIISWFAVDGLAGVRALVSGPAAILWRARYGDEHIVSSLDAALAGAAALLSGTGWASDIEHRARLAAAQRGIRSVAVVDHWVNYRARFTREGVERLPDELWVADDYAHAEARRVLPEIQAIVRPNTYLEEQVALASPPPAFGDVLFVLEPARSDWGRGLPGEFQALDYFMAMRKRPKFGLDRPIRLRPHPSEPADKYDMWLAGQHNVALDCSDTIGVAMRGAAIVVGLNSFAMVVALASGRRVISALPPWAPPCILPHTGIERLQSIDNGK